MGGIAVTGVKHLVVTRVGVTGSPRRTAGTRSCTWPTHANSRLETDSPLSEFNRLMSAAGRGLAMVTLSAAWRQVKDNRRPSEKGRQIVRRAGALACYSQGREQALTQRQDWRCREKNQKTPGQEKDADKHQ